VSASGKKKKKTRDKGKKGMCTPLLQGKKHSLEYAKRSKELKTKGGGGGGGRIGYKGKKEERVSSVIGVEGWLLWTKSAH